MKKILVVDNTIDPPHGSAEIHQHLEAAAKVLERVEIVIARGPEGAVPDTVDELNGVVLSGSKTRIGESSDWISREMEFIRRLHEAKVPTLGICYGEQLIARALAGERYTGAAVKSEFGWVELEQCSAGARSPIFHGLPKKFYSYEAHSDEVYELPKGFSLTARSTDCGVQAFDVQGAPMWGIQFHPERGLEEGNRSLDRRLSQEPGFRAINRDRAEKLYDPTVAEVIFRNFLRLVLAGK